MMSTLHDRHLVEPFGYGTSCGGSEVIWLKRHVFSSGKETFYVSYGTIRLEGVTYDIMFRENTDVYEREFAPTQAEDE